MIQSGLNKTEQAGIALGKHKRRVKKPTKVKPLTPEQIEAVLADLKSGATYQATADKFKTTRMAIAGYAYRANYNRREDRETVLALRRFSWQ